MVSIQWKFQGDDMIYGKMFSYRESALDFLMICGILSHQDIEYAILDDDREDQPEVLFMSGFDSKVNPGVKG